MSDSRRLGSQLRESIEPDRILHRAIAFPRLIGMDLGKVEKHQFWKLPPRSAAWARIFTAVFWSLGMFALDGYC